jgi:RecA-family ATPase
VNNIRFRYGATSMIAGKPGSFKSVLALNLLTRWVQAGYSALYFSADSDEHTVARRLAGILTNTPSQQVDADFINRHYSKYLPALHSLSGTLFEYRALEMDEVADRLNTYEAFSRDGSYPDIVFLDNLINFAPSTDDWGYMRDMTNGLDQLARETKSHICVLHHASEGWGSAADPVPRAAIQGKITQIPRLVLTTAANERALCVCAVKNTNGPQYPDATKWMLFDVQESLKVTDRYEEEL